MATLEKTNITVSARIKSPVGKIWKLWTDPDHIIHWNQASEDWFTPRAKNDLREGGRFSYRMEARDGSSGFDFSGIYTRIVPEKEIHYTIDDGRKVTVEFTPAGKETTVTESFEPESTNPAEMQQDGWNAILLNFKNYAESYYGKFIPLHFEICIKAPREKVYARMLGKDTYSEWTSEFNPTSHYDGTWEKGNLIRFLGTDQNGAEGGMISRVKENILNRFVRLEHHSLIMNGKEIPAGSGGDDWKGGSENYSFYDENGRTLLSVDVDCLPKYQTYFNLTWPKALKKLKRMCEQ